MQAIAKTHTGYTVIALSLNEQSPMINHKGGEIAVDELNKQMYVHDIFVVTYGLDSILKACESYNIRKEV